MKAHKRDAPLGRCAPRKEHPTMTLQPLTPFKVDKPLLPWTPRQVVRRMQALQKAMGARLDLSAKLCHPLFTNTLVMPSANLVLAGTNCSRPMYLREGEILADVSQSDVLLLRFDPDWGATFDILLHDAQGWLCGFVAWRRRDGDLWLISEVGRERFIRTSAWGLEYKLDPPFTGEWERHAGIIRAIEHLSFEGRI
jgi:hypothetical protein